MDENSMIIEVPHEYIQQELSCFICNSFNCMPLQRNQWDCFPRVGCDIKK
uniref:Uncharacterized protein n=1 Tax=Anguilla anguilla TaxID=7936 RepID=A0A0E9UZM4_ANGAN